MAVSRLFGSSIKRREDPRLITGKGAFTDDVKLPGMTYMAILRSPYGHAKITRIDTSKAKALPGVVAVFTGKDLEGKLQPIPCAWLIPDSDLKTPPYNALATDTVRFTGDGVAAVVAEQPYIAQDALDLIEVDYEPLPVVTTQEAAMAEGAPQLHEERAGQSGLPLEVRQWRRGGGAGGGRGRPQGALQPAAADSQRDGAARRGGAVGLRHGRADHLEHLAEPAYRALPALRHDRHPGEQDSRHLP